MANPPATCSAPVVVDTALVVPEINMFDAVTVAPTNSPPPTPTPPTTCKAPVFVELVGVVLVIVVALITAPPVNELPLLVLTA